MLKRVSEKEVSTFHWRGQGGPRNSQAHFLTHEVGSQPATESCEGKVSKYLRDFQTGPGI